MEEQKLQMQLLQQLFGNQQPQLDRPESIDGLDLDDGRGEKEDEIKANAVAKRLGFAFNFKKQKRDIGTARNPQQRDKEQKIYDLWISAKDFDVSEIAIDVETVNNNIGESHKDFDLSWEPPVNNQWAFFKDIFYNSKRKELLIKEKMKGEKAKGYIKNLRKEDLSSIAKVREFYKAFSDVRGRVSDIILKEFLLYTSTHEIFIYQQVSIYYTKHLIETKKYPDRVGLLSRLLKKLEHNYKRCVDSEDWFVRNAYFQDSGNVVMSTFNKEGLMSLEQMGLGYAQICVEMQKADRYLLDACQHKSKGILMELDHYIDVMKSRINSNKGKSNYLIVVSLYAITFLLILLNGLAFDNRFGLSASQVKQS